METVPFPSYKLEASRQAAYFNLTSFPLLFHYHKGSPLVYTGVKTLPNIEKWVKTRISPQITIYESSKTQLRAQEELCAEYANCLIGQNISYALLYEISLRMDIQIFLIEGTKSLILYQDYSEKKTIYNDTLDQDSVFSFLSYNLKPAILPLERPYLDQLFNKGGKAIVLIRDRRHRGLDYEIQNIGDTLKPKISLLIADISDPLGKQVQEILRIPDKKLPSLRLIECKGGSLNVIQYDLSDTIFTENIINFFEKWESGMCKPYVLSQDKPKKSEENRVVNIVQQNFEELVIDSKENFLVLFYAPWCEFSRNSLPIIEQLAYDMRRATNLKIGKIDAYNNEVGKDIKGFPTIRLFIATQEGEKTLVEYAEERTLSKLTSFIQKNIKLNYKSDL